jgi:hypothetical protein
LHRCGAVLGPRLSDEALSWSRADWTEALRSSSNRCQVLKGWDDDDYDYHYILSLLFIMYDSLFMIYFFMIIYDSLFIIYYL